MVRCTASFATVAAFRAAFLNHGRGLCFVAHPDDVLEGTALSVVVNIARLKLELDGHVQRGDFDELGTSGLLVELSTESIVKLEAFDAELRASEEPRTPPEGVPLFVPDAAPTPPVGVPVFSRPFASSPSGVQRALPSITAPQPESTSESNSGTQPAISASGRPVDSSTTGVQRARSPGSSSELPRVPSTSGIQRAFTPSASSPDLPRVTRAPGSSSELPRVSSSSGVQRAFTPSDSSRSPGSSSELPRVSSSSGVQRAFTPSDSSRAPGSSSELPRVSSSSGVQRAFTPSDSSRSPGSSSELPRVSSSSGVQRAFTPSDSSRSPGSSSELPRVSSSSGIQRAFTPSASSPDLPRVTRSAGSSSELPRVSPPLAPSGSSPGTTRSPGSSSELPRVTSSSGIQRAFTPSASSPELPRVSSASGVQRALTPSGSSPDLPRIPPNPRSPGSSSELPRVSSNSGLQRALDPAQPQRPFASSGSGLQRALALPSITAPTIAPDGVIARLPPPVAEIPIEALVSPRAFARFEAARDAIEPNVPRATFIYVDVPGVPADGPEGRAYLGRALEVFAAFDAFVDAREPSGVLLGFAAPVARAVAATLAAREAVEDEALRRQVPAGLRAAMVEANLEFRSSSRAPAGTLERARALRTRLQPGELLCESVLAARASQVAVLEPAPGDATFIRAPQPPRPPSTELVGRGALLEGLERRLRLEPGPGIVLRGAEGSGRTAIALEFAARARQRSLAVTSVTAFSSWKHQPGALVAALACAACDVPFALRATQLARALERLQLPPAFIEALRVAAQLTQPPWTFTAGQTAHALRALLHSQAAGRGVVVVVDGLEHLDALGLELFTLLAGQPAPRELTLGLGTLDLQLEGVVTADLPPLTEADLARLVELEFGAPPGPRLATILTTRTGGLPGLAHEWLQWLSARAALAVQGGALELTEAPPELDGRSVLAARLELIPADAARVLESAWAQGETFDPALLSSVAGPSSPLASQRAAALRLTIPAAGRRWQFSSSRVHAAVGELVGRRRVKDEELHGQTMRRLASGWTAAARVDASSIDVLELARALLQAGEVPRAAAVANHALEAALARRAPREAARALQTLATAGAASSAPARRIELLTSGVSCALAGFDGALARVLMNEALAVAQPTQLETAELLLALAKLARVDGDLSNADELLERAEVMGDGRPLETLLFAERGELLELKGDIDRAAEAFTSALSTAEAGRAIARLHGEVDLPARLEARRGALVVPRDPAAAQRHFETSARRWHAVEAWLAEARALSNLASASALAGKLEAAASHFEAAASAAARGGDFSFQARALLGQARALKRGGAAIERVKAIAAEAWKLASAVGWAQGRADAEAVVAP